MKRKKISKYFFDKEAGLKVKTWIEKYCTHVKGEWGGMPFNLEKWQAEEIIMPLFGWKDKETGLRRYRRMFVFVPRKNGKSTLGSAIALYLLCGDKESGAEIYSAASDRLQAAIIHDTAKAMVLQNEELKKRLKIFQTSITYEKNASFYRVLSSDAPRQHGKNSHGVIFDELHTQPNRELWDVLTTSIGARRQPIIATFTTAGFDKNTICYEQYDYAKKVKDGIIQDESFLPVLFESSPEADIFSIKTWKAANPNYGISLKAQYMTEEATRANNEPSYENTFRRLQLNQWTTQDTKWISDEVWMSGGEVVDEEMLEGMPCVVGLDLSSTRDISALVLDFLIDEKHYILPYFFIPELSARERTKKDGVNYDLWVKQGYIIETSGNVIDYGFIKAKLAALATRFRITSVQYDPYNASQIIIDLQDEGFNCEPFRQGFLSMSTPVKSIERLCLSGSIIHGGNPVLRWMCSNVAIVEDAAGNIKISKDKCKEKVDGMVALAMCIGGHLTHGSSNGSVYEDRGIIVV